MNEMRVVIAAAALSLMSCARTSEPIPRPQPSLSASAAPTVTRKHLPRMQHSILELVTNPRHYDGGTVLITGYLVMATLLDGDHAVLFLDRESARMALFANAVSVRFGPCRTRLGSPNAMKFPDPELLPSLPGYALVEGTFEPVPEGSPLGYGTICAVTRVDGSGDPEQGVGENSWWSKNSWWDKVVPANAGPAASASGRPAVVRRKP